MVLDVPTGGTEIGYSLFAGGTITLTENDAPIPPTGGSISTNFDGGTAFLGDTVVVTWTGIADATVNDLVTITQDTWDDPGGSYNYLDSGWFYTSSGTQTAGSTPSTDGTFTTTLVIPFPDPTTYLPKTSQVKLYRGTAPPAYVGATWDYENTP
jgi:hypothetical protein